MKRRDFFRNGSLAALGTATLGRGERTSSIYTDNGQNENTAKNIIFLVSDGMSVGTLNMADMLLQRKEGRQSNWLKMYQEMPVRRALMDMASENSIVTDSAAASSSWGGGKRVPNGALNTNADGSSNLPIWQKMKQAGKAAGCVTTVPITHATPAGFCVSNKKRSAQPEIALQYLELGFDVMMGGGLEYFSSALRKDKVDVFAQYKARGYKVALNKSDMESAGTDHKILGVFSEDGLPYSVDHLSDSHLKATIPTLASMTEKAIQVLNKNKNGFVLQVEGGKVDWAAHGNDVAALLYDQIAFDNAVGVALEFARNDGNTLVIVTTDHGNANPGTIYGKNVNENFDRIQHFKQSNSWVLNSINNATTPAQLIEKIHDAQGIALTTDATGEMLGYYAKLADDGLYNPRHLPFNTYAKHQGAHTSVGWISMDHSGDYVECSMTGPGAALLKPYLRNYELHNLMLEAVGVRI